MESATDVNNSNHPGRHPGWHPNDELLASFGDPALGPDAQEELALHLDSCAACQARLERMEPALSQYAQCLDVVHSRMSRSTRPFPEFSIESIKVRKQQPPKRSPYRYVWGGAIAASIAGLVFFALTGNTSELRAESLLTRASQAPVRRSAKTRLKIRTQNASFIRPVAQALACEAGSQAEACTTDAAVREHFAAAHYDWQDPLSAQSYASWRSSLKNKSSKVSTPAESEEQIETTTNDGELRDASLTFDAKLMPVSGMFRFADQEWVEITTLPDVETNRVADVAPQPVPAPPAVASAGNSPREPLAERELAVRVAIDVLHAGASEPIEVSTSSGDILVTAYHLSPDQEKKLQSSLDKIGGVVVRTVSDSVELKQSGSTERAGEHPGDRAEIILRTSQDFSFEAHMLKELADHFPPAVEATLVETSKTKLSDLRLNHAREMNRHLARLQQQLAQESNEFRVASATPPPEPSANGIQDLATAASSLDRGLIMLYAPPDTNIDPKSNPGAWAGISGQVSRLRTLASQYSRYLEEERKKRE